VRSIKLTPGKAKQLASALDLIERYTDPVAEVWHSFTDEQREKLLAHSPVLARLVSLAGRFETWPR
jgi:hypothetical protein